MNTIRQNYCQVLILELKGYSCYGWFILNVVNLTKKDMGAIESEDYD